MLALLLALLPQAEAAPTAAAPSDASGPALVLEDLERWRAYLEPPERELAFERLDWLPDLTSGLEAAGARRLPLLLWVSDGHPLGSASSAGIGERALFDDSRVTSLATHFLLVTDDAGRLATGSGADCEFFRDAVRASPWQGVLYDGLWVLAPDGTMLAHASTRNPAIAARALYDGFQAWKQVPGERRRLPDWVALGAPPAADCPEDGLVLERVARDLGPGAPAGEPAPGWNRGYAWFSHGEVEALVPADPVEGETFDLSGLVTRLASFDLVDDVHGSTEPYALEELETAELVARVVEREETRLALELEGRTHAEGEGFWSEGYGIWAPRQEPPHGMQCRLVGRAAFDLATGTFTELELVAVGRRYGRTERNGRRQATGEGWVGFRFALAPEGVCIPPAFLPGYPPPWNPAPSEDEGTEAAR